VLERDDRGVHVGSGRANPSPGDRTWVFELPVGPAVEADRTHRALGGGREADRLPELHQRLVEPGGPEAGEEAFEGRAELLAHGGRAEVAFLPGPTGRHAKAVGLQRHLGRVEREARDRPGDVGPDPGQGFELGNGPGQLSAEGGSEDPGRGMEVPGAGVVAGALPRLQHLGPIRRSERGDAREPVDEPLEVRNGLGDARLLQENLSDPDAVRVAAEPPGERASVDAEPVEQRHGRSRGNGRNTTGPGALAHGGPPEEESA